MQFAINRKDLTCLMYFSDDTHIEVTMDGPFDLSEKDDGSVYMCSDLVTIKYLDAKGSQVAIFDGVTSDEFGGIIKEMQHMHVVPALMDEVQAMDDAMNLTQADLQGGSDNA